MGKRSWRIAAAFLFLFCCAALLTAPASADPEKELPVPQIELTADEVTRGEFLEIKVLNLSDFEAFRYFEDYPIAAYVKGYGDSCPVNYWGYIRIPTQGLNPAWLQEEDGGQFTVVVQAHDQDGREKTAEAKFTVTEPPVGELKFLISEEEAVTREQYILSVYAPGANRIEIYDNWECVYRTYGEEGQTEYGYNFRGEYSYYAKAYYTDESGENEISKVSDTLKVKVTAPYGDVADPGVTMPEVLVYGDTLNFEVKDINGYTSWNLNIKRESDNQEIWHSWGDPGEPISVPSRVHDYDEYPEDGGEPVPVYRPILEPGEVYNVELGFFRYGYHGFSYDVPLLVLAEDTRTDGIEMSVNGQTDTLEIAAHQDVSWHVRGPENATGLLVYAGYNWQFFRGNEYICDWGWWTMNHIPEFLFFAKYTTDPIPEQEFSWQSLTWENAVSNVVRVINTTKGYLPAPAVQLSADPVSRGEWLTAVITNLDDYADYPGIRFYAAPYYDLTGNSFGFEYDWDGTDRIRIPTSNLDPENRTEPFSLHVTATTGVGWYETTSRIPFTVVEPTEPSVAFEVSPTELETTDPFTISLHASGAEAYRILENGNEVRSGEGGSFTEHWTGHEPGQRTIQAFVRYPGETEWTEAGSADVTVTAPNGELPELTLIAPETLKPGEDLVLSFSGTDSEVGVDVRVWRADDEDAWVWHAWGDEYSYVVPAVQPVLSYHMEQLQKPGEAVLEPGVEYAYWLHVKKRGYVSRKLSGTVRIEGDIPEGLTVSKTEVELFEDFDVRVHVSGATAIALNEDFGSWAYAAGEEISESVTAWDEGEMKLYARYATMEFDPKNADWQNPEWEGWTGETETVSVTVHPPKYELEDVAFSVASDTVSRGESFVITIENKNEGIEGVSYGAHLQPIGEYIAGYTWYGTDEEDDHRILVNTQEVEPGEYNLLVSANAISCRGKFKMIPVTVTDPGGEQNLTTLVLPAGLKTISKEAFAGIAARKIVVPAGVETIESGAFAGCPNLIAAELPEGIASFAQDAFDGCGEIKISGTSAETLADYAGKVDHLVPVSAGE